MLKYCQNCYTKPRRRAVTNMNLMDVCSVCAMEISKDIPPKDSTVYEAPWMKRYLKAMGVR